ncbi:MAG TPA: hypothetical protein VIV61_18705 [Candidatus Ozemobacteraceae bacterium]
MNRRFPRPGSGIQTAMPGRLLLALITLMFFCSLGGPAMSQDDTTRTFRYDWTKGQKLFYLVTVRGGVDVETPMGVQSNPVHIEMQIRQSVEDASKDLATMSMLILVARMIQDGDSAPLPEEGQTSVLWLDRRGKVEIVSGTGAWQGSEVAQMHFPEQPLKPGDSWVQKNRTQGQTVTETATRYTYTGMTARSGKRLAEFESEMLLESGEKQVGDPSAISRGRTWFDPDLGQVVETIADSRFTFFVPVPDQPNMLARSSTTLHTEMKLTKREP